MFKGEKVTLRPVRREDLPLLNAFNNDVEVELASGGDPPMPQPLPMLEAEYEQQWAKGGRDNASFVIEADGKCIGGCALFDMDHTAHTAQLGIIIGDKEYWGRGYGRDAVRTLVHYAFRYRNFRRVWLRVHANNERGMRAYRAAGFVEEGRLRQHVYSDGSYDDMVYMGVLREEWEVHTP
ncbi:MAG: RimJ/RimL family protein N-acetyltransferase [Anaerolineaceae bacterium]|nr:RimJ/RimL family protein N-acetyltransferase [Anaerolineaceae bacterium]